MLSDRMRRLQEALQIAIDKKNPVLESSIRRAIREEEQQGRAEA